MYFNNRKCEEVNMNYMSFLHNEDVYPNLFSTYKGHCKVMPLLFNCRPALLILYSPCSIILALILFHAFLASHLLYCDSLLPFTEHDS